LLISYYDHSFILFTQDVKKTVFLSATQLKTLPSVVAEWLTLLLHIREVPGTASAWRPAILTEGFRGFPLSGQGNAEITTLNYATAACLHILPHNAVEKTNKILTTNLTAKCKFST
jgi:hypothetical protein